MKPVFDNFAEPPGVFIREELEARGWSQRDLAFILGYTEQTVTKVISGKSGISAEMAKALASAFGTSAELWAGLQKEWELRQAQEPDPAVKARANMQGVFPVREMINRGWLNESEQSVLELQFMRFFEAANMNDIPQMAFAGAAKKTDSGNHSPEELAWLYRVRQVARTIDVPKFSVKRLKDILPKLRSLMIDVDDVQYVPELLNEAGVRFVIVEKITKAEIDGVCTWLDNSSPVIGMTTRHDRLNNFWFVLRHEIEHIIQGDGKDKIGIIDDLDGRNGETSSDISEEERIADEASLSFGFSRDKLKSFYDRKAPYISEKDIIGFSGLSEVHPAIAIGQIQYLKDDYRWLRKWLVKYRDKIVDSAFVDGFGNTIEVTM